jgi:hypothetical protein
LEEAVRAFLHFNANFEWCSDTMALYQRRMNSVEEALEPEGQFEGQNGD